MLLVIANKPGYLPEGEPQEAVTLRDAREALIASVTATAEIVGDYQGGEAFLEALKCAKSARVNDVVTYCGYVHSIVIEDGTLWLEPFCYALQCVASAMEYEALENGYLEQPLKEITEERFFDMLGCLPPLMWKRAADLETFCICEMQIGDITEQYARLGDRYFSRYVNIKKPDTFINCDEILKVIANGS